MDIISRVDWVAITFYDGIVPEDSPQFAVPGAGMTVDDLVVAGLASAKKHRPATLVKEHIAQINRRIELYPDKIGPVKLVGYEGGFNGCYFSNDLPDATRVRQATALRYHPGYRDIVHELIQSCSDAGMEYMCTYAHAHVPVAEGGGYPIHGAWPFDGAMAANPDGTSPKYPELLKDMAGVPPGLPDLSRVGSVAGMVVKSFGKNTVVTDNLQKTADALRAAVAARAITAAAKTATTTVVHEEAVKKDNEALKVLNAALAAYKAAGDSLTA